MFSKEDGALFRLCDPEGDGRLDGDYKRAGLPPVCHFWERVAFGSLWSRAATANTFISSVATSRWVLCTFNMRMRCANKLKKGDFTCQACVHDCCTKVKTISRRFSSGFESVFCNVVITLMLSWQSLAKHDVKDTITC